MGGSLHNPFQVGSVHHLGPEEFLKELWLTEGIGTGIPTIKARLEENGSPAPLFDTDGEDRRYFLIEFPVHPVFLNLSRDQVEVKLEALKSVGFQLFAAFVNMREDGEWDKRETKSGPCWELCCFRIH